MRNKLNLSHSSVTFVVIGFEGYRQNDGILPILASDQKRPLNNSVDGPDKLCIMLSNL